VPERRCTKDCGIKGLNDRDRKPKKPSNQLPFQIEKIIVHLKKEKPNWGAPKIRELLMRRHPEIKTPAKSTVHAVLDRNGLVNKKDVRDIKQKEQV